MKDTNLEKPAEPTDISSAGFSASPNPLITENFFNQVEGEKFVVFFLNGNLYAVAAKEVAEVTQPLPVAFLPNAPECVSGIANLRGEIITILDLPKILDVETAEISKKAKFVVLQSKNFNSLVAFKVERVGEIITLPSGQIEAVEETAATAHIFGKAAHKLGVLNLINTENMLASLAF